MTKTEGSILKIKLGGKDKENSGGKEGEKWGGKVKGKKTEKLREIAQEKREVNGEILMEENWRREENIIRGKFWGSGNLLEEKNKHIMRRKTKEYEKYVVGWKYCTME